MAAEIGTATDFVHVEFYISRGTTMTDAVLRGAGRATERGVTVRLLFDHLGSRGIPGYKEMLAELDAHRRSSGTRCCRSSRFKGKFQRPDLRNHRKILVVDGRVAFTGSQNLIEPGYDKPKNHKAGREWDELMTRVEGPSVPALNVVFVTDWYTETDERASPHEAVPPASQSAPARRRLRQVVPSGPGFADREQPAAVQLADLLRAAAASRSRAPTSCPTSRCSTPSRPRPSAASTWSCSSCEGDQFMVYHAQRSYYEALLEAGVRIFLYPAPYVLHAKHFTIDDDVAVHRVEQHGHALVRLNYEVVDDGARRGDRGHACARCRTTTGRCRASSPSRSGSGRSRRRRTSTT